MVRTASEVGKFGQCFGNVESGGVYEVVAEYLGGPSAWGSSTVVVGERRARGVAAPAFVCASEEKELWGNGFCELDGLT